MLKLYFSDYGAVTSLKCGYAGSWINRNVVIGEGSPQAQQTKGRFTPCPSPFMHSSCAHQYLLISHWASDKAILITGTSFLNRPAPDFEMGCLVVAGPSFSLPRQFPPWFNLTALSFCFMQLPSSPGSLLRWPLVVLLWDCGFLWGAGEGTEQGVRSLVTELHKSLWLSTRLHYRSKVWGHPDNFVFSMKTHFYLSNELQN